MIEKTKFKVGFVKHINLGNYESETYSLEAEYLQSEMPFPNAFAEVMEAVLMEVKINHPEHAAVQSLVREVEQKPDVESLPWREFKNRKGAWIFANESDAEDLYKKLEAAPGKTLEISDYKYTISGDQGQFISRFKKAEQEAQ